MKLLKETSDFKYSKDDLEENNGKLSLKGIIQRADTRNQNGRVYPRDILIREIENYKRLVTERKALGELDHADDPVVNLKNVSHLITDIWIEGDVVWGQVEVLPTPQGKILRSLVESEVQVGISSRALGSVRHSGDSDVVQDDLHFICWDFVSEPSTPGAWMMKEAKEVDPSVINKIFSREDRIDRAAYDIIQFHKKLTGEEE